MRTPGWTTNSFNSNNWSPVNIATFTPSLIYPQLFEPIRKLSQLTPRYINEPQPNIFVVDFGQNTAGKFNFFFLLE